MRQQWSEKALEAMLELDRITGEGSAVIVHEAPAEQPAVQRGCICPNRHQPDENNFIITSPSCEIHGCRSRYMQRSSLSQADARTVGVIHRSSVRGG